MPAQTNNQGKKQNRKASVSFLACYCLIRRWYLDLTMPGSAGLNFTRIDFMDIYTFLCIYMI
ncbi:MAG: hypothetical protein ACTSRZ_05385 [Promethearchaeota archaeon]